MRSILLLGFFFMLIPLVAQVTFEPGYITDKTGNRQHCLIRYYQWRDNPREIQYKLTETGMIMIGDSGNLKEFGVSGYCRYILASVRIDRSARNVNSLSVRQAPEWSEERIFLKVLVEGDASLYSYEDQSVLRFFYSVQGSAPEQLVYKEFVIYDQEGTQIKQNNQFRQQLWMQLRCGGTDPEELEKLKYSRGDLTRYFIKYNNCSGSSVVEYGKTSGQRNVHFALAAGMANNTMKLSNPGEFPGYEETKRGFTFQAAAEVEYLLPFYRNKWGFIVMPEYIQFKSEGVFLLYPVKTNYRVMDFPVGIRHYFFLGRSRAFHLDACYIPGFGIDFGTKLTLSQTLVVPLHKNHSLVFGAGFDSGKFSIEGRFYSPFHFINHSNNWYADLQRECLMVKWKIY